MEARVVKLEEFAQDTRERLTHIETRLESMDANMATQAEMHNMKAELVKWIVGTAVGLGAAGITVFSFVLNHASPKGASAASHPIVIHMPPLAPAPAHPGE